MEADKNKTVDIREMLELQLAEVEMLASMFSNTGEFTLDSSTILRELRDFVDGKIGADDLDSRIGFTVKITTSSPVELVCHFPHEYPAVLPEVFTRVPSMDRESHKHLGEDLHEFLSSLELGQILVGSVVEWLQQNADNYLKIKQDSTADRNTKSKSEKDGSFTRLWIYSHHIFSKFKRKDILEWAHELRLHGFSMPGKPGLICIEGYTIEVDEFWSRLRRLNWKRIMIKEQEVLNLEGKEIANMCKFDKFQELDFLVQGSKGRTIHMDLGKFYEFLQQHDSAHIFSAYFGVEGKSGGDC